MLSSMGWPQSFTRIGITRLPTKPMMVPQVTTRAQDPPRSYKLLGRKVATIPYRVAVASTQPPSGALVQASPSGSQASAGVANFNLLFPRFAARYDCSLDAPEPRRKP